MEESLKMSKDRAMRKDFEKTAEKDLNKELESKIET